MISPVRVVWILVFAANAGAQLPEIGAPLEFARLQGPAAPPTVITLQDALDRAKAIDASFQSAVAEAQIAREDRLQAKASMLPSLSHTSQYLGTQGNGVSPSGRFVASDGVHVYRSLAVIHQEISPNTILKTDYRSAQAAEALANAKVEIAQRGLAVAVTGRYYDLVAAERRYATAQQAVQQAQRFLDITQQQENLGQAAHSDVVKADIQLQQQRQSFQEATLAIENTRLNLAVVLSSGLNENFAVVDDLDSSRSLPPFADLQTMAERDNPEMRSVNEALRRAGFDVRAARNAFLPSLAIDGNYGIEANAFKLHSTAAAAPELGPLPNLGYFVTFSLSVPIFDWGATRSKVRQAQTRQQQARVELSQTQRQLATNLYTYYNEAVAARAAVDLVRHTADLATDSLRLINLRYTAGESNALEVVDAQNTLIQARNAYDDSQIRYRVAIAALQAITGSF